jgi:hypothetical protein
VVAAAGIGFASQYIQKGIKYIARLMQSLWINEDNIQYVSDRHCGVILAFDLAAEMQRGNERNLIPVVLEQRCRDRWETDLSAPPFTTTASELQFLYDTILEFSWIRVK